MEEVKIKNSVIDTVPFFHSKSEKEVKYWPEGKDRGNMTMKNFSPHCPTVI
jgi:hypothetical protein